MMAQRVSYQQLVMRAQSPTIFIDDILLPGKAENTTLAFIFRFNNDFIPFKKIPTDGSIPASGDAQFYSTIRLNAEIFEGKLDRKRPSANAVTRDIWSDTLYAANFEETQSSKHFASGYLSAQLSPGQYNFMLQLAMMQDVNERNSQRSGINIPDLSTKKTGEVLLVASKNGDDYQLMNMEKNVPFGKDFYALIRIPNYDSTANYTLTVTEASPSKNDTTSGKSVYSAELNPNNIFPESTLRFTDNKEPTLRLETGNSVYTYAFAKIPAGNFENAPYFLNLFEKGNKTVLARTFFRSYWPDMPASLYNLNVAIQNLKYILSEKELKEINSGGRKKKEEKFREFWKSKDPTPNTVFNELMAEYYRRIDYAFKEFRSQENPLGHESDQGEIYIKFGPPSKKERKFPKSGKTIEVWTYPNRTFVFEAGSGFGDFVLVGTKK